MNTETMIVGAQHYPCGYDVLRPYPDEQNPPKINVKPGSLGAIVRSYKSAVAYRLNKEYNATGIWQRNYVIPRSLWGHDRIIRNDRESDAVRRYIESNPHNWAEDGENLMIRK